MKHKKDKKTSKHDKKKSKKKDKKGHKTDRMYRESNSSSSSSEEEQEWVEKIVPSSEQSTSVTLKESQSLKREDWMDIKSIFPCVFNEKKTSKDKKNEDKPDLDKVGQSNRELNPYWKNGGNGLPEISSMKTSLQQVTDVNWLKKSLQRAKEQANHEGRSLEEIAAERWGSLDVIKSMIAKAEEASVRTKPKNSLNSNKWLESGKRFRNDKNNEESRSKSLNRYRGRNCDNPQYKRQEYKRPDNDDSYSKLSHKSTTSGPKKWQKQNVSDKTEKNQPNINTSKLKVTDIQDDITEPLESKETKALTEAEMNKLGAKIIKAEIMGDMELAEELKLQLKKARELGTNTASTSKAHEVQNIILAQTDARGVTRPLELRGQSSESSEMLSKRKNQQTHVSGKRVRHYFDDDKYSLQQLFQREKGRFASEDDAEFLKVASKNMDMDDLFEEQITRAQSNTKQDNKERMNAIKEHKRLSKSLDNCRWCIDSKYMLKHMIITIDSEICLSLPSHTSLTEGHCIISPVEHIACQLQLEENVWERLKMLKQVLYKMFRSQDKYPIFYEVYKHRHKFSHMQLECVPLPKDIGRSAPMYFKKALLECETEWTMNKRIIDLENKSVRQVIPNGLSYFMVEFETDKGYAHVIEDENMFPTNFAEEIIGGMLDLDHDVWRKPKKENFDRQREKVLTFTNVWKQYQQEIVN